MAGLRTGTGTGLGTVVRSRATPWWRTPADRLDGVAPGLLADFKRQRYALGRSVGLGAILAVTNSAPGWYQTAAGSWVQAAAHTPRIDWSSGVPELLLEGPTTNAIRNSSMQGASVGVLPTNWSSGGDAVLTVVGVGAEKGIDYIDVRMQGTMTNGFVTLFPDGNGATIPAANGQVWSSSVFAKIIAGSFPATVSFFGLRGRMKDAGGAPITDLANASIHGSMTAAMTRFATTMTLNQAATAFYTPFLALLCSPGDTVDLTVRIGWPQAEQWPVASSPVRTTGAVTGRGGDLCQLSAAAAAVLQGPSAALVWRGSTPYALSFQHIIGITGGNQLVRLTGSPGSNTAFVGHSTTGLIHPTNWAPGSAGIAFGWGPAGRRAAVNGVGQEDTVVLDQSRSTIFVGPATILVAGAILRTRQLVGWALPDRPSAAGVQAQAIAA